MTRPMKVPAQLPHTGQHGPAAVASRSKQGRGGELTSEQGARGDTRRGARGVCGGQSPAQVGLPCR